MKKKTILMIILINILVLLIAFGFFAYKVDSYLLQNAVDPMFTIVDKNEIYMDGGTYAAYGLGYKVYVYKDMGAKTAGGQIGFWNMKLDSKKCNITKIERFKQIEEYYQSVKPVHVMDEEALKIYQKMK